jgi:enoyl-CoA hydratase/carnithine racemase
MNEPTTIRWESGSDGIVLLTLDDPARSVNTMSPDYVRSMGIVIDRLEEERDSLVGVVITSAKMTFFTGGDPAELLEVEPRQIDPRHAARIAAKLTQVRAQLRRLRTLGRPVVAAINGSALGRGLEIALACHHRVAADVEGSLIGLPEGMYGPTQNGGGVRRGHVCTPIEALEVGLVHDVVDTVDELIPRARQWIRANRHAYPRPVECVGDSGQRAGEWPDDLYASEVAEQLLAAAPELPDEPTEAQVDAWFEFVNLIRDPTFRLHRRQMGWASYTDPARRAKWMKLAAIVVHKAAKASDAGVDPASKAAAPVVNELVGLFAADAYRADDVTFRRDLLDMVEIVSEPPADRYWQLVATITGRPPVATWTYAWRWFVNALRAHS